MLEVEPMNTACNVQIEFEKRGKMQILWPHYHLWAQTLFTDQSLKNLFRPITFLFPRVIFTFFFSALKRWRGTCTCI